jgi:hypothetical protein
MSEKKTTAKPKARVSLVICCGDRPEDEVSWADWVEIAADATRHDEDVRIFAARFAADALSDHAAGCREKRLEREAEEKADAQASEDAAVLARITNTDILEARLRELTPVGVAVAYDEAG